MKSFNLLPQQLELFDSTRDASSEAVIGLDAPLASFFGNTGAKSFLIEVKLDFVSAFFCRTEELSFRALDE